MNEIMADVQTYFSGEKTITKTIFNKYKKWMT